MSIRRSVGRSVPLLIFSDFWLIYWVVVYTALFIFFLFFQVFSKETIDQWTLERTKRLIAIVMLGHT